MKERFLTFLTVVTLLVTLAQPILLQGRTRPAFSGMMPTGECHDGNVCGG